MSDGRTPVETVEGTSRLAQRQTAINAGQRTKNLVGDLWHDGVAERLQSVGSVGHAFGDSRYPALPFSTPVVWSAAYRSVHPSG